MNTAITALLVLAVCLFAVKWIFNAIGLQFDHARGGIIVKTVRRFRKGMIVFVIALFIIGIIATYVTPRIIGAIEAVAAGITSSALSSVNTAHTVGQGTVRAALIVLGIVLSLAYWTAASLWFDRHIRTKDGRILAQLAAGVPYLGAFLIYVKLFIV